MQTEQSLLFYCRFCIYISFRLLWFWIKLALPELLTYDVPTNKQKKPNNIEIICHAWKQTIHRTQLFGTINDFFSPMFCVLSMTANRIFKEWLNFNKISSKLTDSLDSTILIDVVCKCSTCHFDRIRLRLRMFIIVGCFLCVLLNRS